jgi:hypothetical protein
MTSEILLRRETIEREEFIELLEGKTEEEVRPGPGRTAAAAHGARDTRAQTRTGPQAAPTAGAGRRTAHMRSP